ncbi:MAG TPA: DNA gyrase subunit A, partial [Thermoplasmata archaeon]|nr:DNA gyrase subunit A [Thermoplasmata archaeon]
LKPVHRRILHAMNEMGNTKKSPHKKCARIVGETLGKFHPHGDVAIYDTLVRLAQPFSMRYPLVDGQGNFGSVDGDSAAAMRYTECRLDAIANEMLADIDKETVDFTDNFDGTLKEPLVLPSKLPNLLINGSSGIAVGMATNIPPHNLCEIVDATIHTIDHPDADVRELMDIVRGPDFPTGGIVYGIDGIVEAYTTGHGRIRVRARTHFEDEEDHSRVIITEIPYNVKKSDLLETIAELVKTKKIEGISDLRDESDKEGMRVVIDLKRDAINEVVLNQLFAHTQMQVTFGIINLALVDNQPVVLSLKEMIDYFIEHRFDVVKRRTKYDLDQAKARAHILEGLITAIDNLDEVIKLIRRAKQREEARDSLMKRFLLSELQAKAILEMQLQRLTGLEMRAVKDEYEQVSKKVEELQRILGDEKALFGIIKSELLEVKEKYGDERRTEIVMQALDLDIEDLIPVEDVVVMITNTGYIKRLPLETYKQQRRGGVGLMGMETKEEDYVVDLFVTSSHDYIMFFSSKGRVYWLKAYRVPAAGRHAKGKPIVNLIERLDDGEVIMDTIPVVAFDEEQYLVFATKKGTVKKTRLSSYQHVRASGIVAIKLDDDDELIDTTITDGTKEIVLATHKGMACRFDEKDVRPTGRATYGVRGIRLKKGDEVVSMAIVSPQSQLLTITETGYGKRTLVEHYRKTRRGGVGVITIKTGGRNGNVVMAKEVTEGTELIVTSKSGMVIRIQAEEIRLVGRATMGVRIMRLKGRDKICAVAGLVGYQEEERRLSERRTLTPNGEAGTPDEGEESEENGGMEE